MNRKNSPRGLAAFSLTATLFLIPLGATAALSESEAATACETVISEKPSLGGFQSQKTKAQPFGGGWQVTGEMVKGSERRPFLCKIDDKGRVATATLSSEPKDSAAKPEK